MPTVAGSSNYQWSLIPPFGLEYSDPVAIPEVVKEPAKLLPVRQFSGGRHTTTSPPVLPKYWIEIQVGKDAGHAGV